jgi:aspartyl-tRNA(Asn)/glutamyl-tRNA(Gln) amidotransferase subunit A
MEYLISKTNLPKREQSKLTKTTRSFRIGIPEEYFDGNIEPIIKEALTTLIRKLKSIGHQIVPIALPLTKYAVNVYYMTMGVEVASNLERLDGIRYAKQEDYYEELYVDHRTNFFGDEAQRRIIMGTYASSAGYYDAYYNKAQKVRELARRDFDIVFEKCDLILTPTSSEFPFRIGTKTQDPLTMYYSDIYTCGVNPCKIPGMNVPIGLYNTPYSAHRLPAGCQILGPELQDYPKVIDQNKQSI